ncbi:hypothetical protein ACA910_000800 [Epithemia clementina (nom. ined.)]
MAKINPALFAACILALLRRADAFSPYSNFKRDGKLQGIVSNLVRPASVTPTISTAEVSSPEVDSFEHADALVCGGGPAGLLTAIMLAQKLPSTSIRVYDRLSEPPNPDDEMVWNDVAKFYLIGLGGRGQAALKHFGVWDEVKKRCVAVVGRRNWEPDGPEDGVERVFTKKDKKVTAQVLPRDKLVGVLHKYIVEHYKDRITLFYGHELRPLKFDFSKGSQVLVEVSKCSAESSQQEQAADPAVVLCDTENIVYIATDLLIAADGTVRTIANEMEKADQRRFAAMNPIKRLFAGQPFRVKRFVDDNQRVYKTVPLKVPKSWRPDINYSARSKGSKTTFDALPANSDGSFCGVLLLKKDDEIARADTDPDVLRKRLDADLPQFSALLSDDVVATIAQKPVSYLPGFRYAGPRLHEGNRCLILGDCAHTVKPYFGLGANSALEDVKVLGDILSECHNDLTQSVLEFSRRRSGEAKALVRISRDLDRPGNLGFVTFIIPLILDSIFNGILPQIFTPNIIAMLQRQEYTFQQVGRRKRLDRAAQVGLVTAVVGSVGFIVKASISRLSLLTGLKGVKLWASVCTLCSLAVLGRNIAAPFVFRVASNVTNSRTHLTPLRHILKKNNKAANGESFLTPLGFGNQKDQEKKAETDAERG